MTDDLTTARAYGRWLEDQDKSEWPFELSKKMFFALRAREHRERPASEQSESLTMEDTRMIAEADAAHSAFIASQGGVTMEWQPIETSPRDGSTVLICGTGINGYFVADAKWDNEWLLFHPDDDARTVPCHEPTHWMPLPAPPPFLANKGT